jgi:hypothetical protein
LTKDWIREIGAKLKSKGVPYPVARSGLVRAVAFQKALVEHAEELSEMGATEIRGVGVGARVHWHDNLIAIFAGSPLDADGELPWDKVVWAWNEMQKPVLTSP